MAKSAAYLALNVLKGYSTIVAPRRKQKDKVSNMKVDKKKRHVNESAIEV